MLGLVKTKHSGNTFNKDIIIKLSDFAGVGRLSVQDADGATVWSVDSKGNVRKRGQELRI